MVMLRKAVAWQSEFVAMLFSSLSRSPRLHSEQSVMIKRSGRSASDRESSSQGANAEEALPFPTCEMVNQLWDCELLFYSLLSKRNKA